MSHGHRAVLGATVVAFALLFFVEGALLPTAWLPVEEASTLAHARGQANATSAHSVLYPVLLAPAARSLSPSAAYRFAKALSALLWALVAIPAFVLARRLVGPGASLAVAALAVAAPGAVYATAAVPDALALLLAVSSLALLARASAGAGRTALVGALAFATAAALVRPWFVVLPSALLVAYDLSRDGEWTFLRWPLSLVFAGYAAFGYLVLAATAPEVGDAFAAPGAVARAAAASLVVVALGAGVVPWLLAGSGARATARPERALFATCLVALVVAAGVFGVGPGLDERPLLVLVPLTLALAASAWSRRSARAGAGVVVAALLVLAAFALPALGRPPVAHAAGLSLAAPDGASRAGLIAGVVVVVAVSLVALFATRRSALVVPVALALLVVGGHAAAWSGVRGEARALASEQTGPRSWVDRRAGSGARVFVVGPAGTLDAEGEAQLALWNRTVSGSRAVDVSLADPKTGLLPVSDTEVVLARGVDVVGTVLARSAAGALVRPTLPLQLLETVEGVDADGWSGEEATYRRFGGPARAGKVHVTVSRAAWTGEDRPGEVTIATGPLDGDVQARAHVVVHAGESHELDVDVPPAPFRVVVTVRPTFSPSEFGGADTRQLGAQLRFAYGPP